MKREKSREKENRKKRYSEEGQRKKRKTERKKTERRKRELKKDKEHISQIFSCSRIRGKPTEEKHKEGREKG